MICDQCAKPKEEKCEGNMIVKISLKGYSKKLKQSKLDFKTIGTTARTRRIFEKKYESQNCDKRRLDSSKSNSQEKIVKKVQREKRRIDVHPYSYEELGIIPVKYFDYSKYKNVLIIFILGLV
jgi:chromodomain-helicase-DNA-binding protein 7